MIIKSYKTKKNGGKVDEAQAKVTQRVLKDRLTDTGGRGPAGEVCGGESWSGAETENAETC